MHTNTDTQTNRQGGKRHVYNTCTTTLLERGMSHFYHFFLQHHSNIV